MTADHKNGQRGRTFDAQTTQHVKKALQEQALTLAVEQCGVALAAESMTTKQIQQYLSSAAKAQNKGETKGSSNSDSK